MEFTPTYSVIVPHYMDAKRLNRLLLSIPFARCDIQVIVVDDCSSDQFELDVLRVRWDEVLWLSTALNSGAGAARNVGLDAALGEWIVFADSDDEFLVGSFEVFDKTLRHEHELVYYLAEAKHESDGGSSNRTNKYNKLVADYNITDSAGDLLDLKLGHVVPWAKVYSKGFIERTQLRFDEVRLSNDLAFNVLAAINAEYISTFQIYIYRSYRRDLSLTMDKSADAFMQRFLVSHSVAQRLSDNGYKNIWPATGMILKSFFYGPKIFIEVLILSLTSHMLIEWRRIFDVKRWINFVKTQKVQAQEDKKFK